MPEACKACSVLRKKLKKSGFERRWKRNESVVGVLTAEAGKVK